MHQDEDIQVAGTMTDYLIEKFTDKEQGKEFACEYLKSAFLASAVNSLFYMRRQAGLTQAQVAERLHTKQSAIARLEGDFEGSISLRRYVDFALACDMLPHDITFAPLSLAVSYTLAQPNIPYTQANYQEWLNASSLSVSAPIGILNQQESSSEIISNTLQTQGQVVFPIRMSLGNWPINKAPYYVSCHQGQSNNPNIVSPATTLSMDKIVQQVFQPCLVPPLQLVHGEGITSTVANQPYKGMAA